MYANKHVRVISWGKDGWKGKAATKEQKQQYSAATTKILYYDLEFGSEQTITSDLNLLQSVQSKIQTGSIHEEIDKLPGALRHILQSEDTWYLANGKVMKIVDPITQAQDGGWGADSSEGDVDVLAENKTVIRMHLEDTHLLTDDKTTEEYQDLMGELLETANGEMISASPMCRADTTVEYIGEDEDEETDDEYVMQFRQTKCFTPVLSTECQQEILHLKSEMDSKVGDVDSDVEKELLIATYDQKIDQVAGRELCNKLDSPYCGHKYSQPRRKYEFIFSERTSHLTEAAQEREKFFYTLFSEVSSCTSKDTLFGRIEEYKVISQDTGKEVTKRGRPNGFVGKIRGMYQHDKELAIVWSINDIEGSESAFTIQRRDFIRKLRDEKKDEESIRKSVWSWFDKVATTIPAVYKYGKLVSPARRWKDSIWRQRRTQALKDLFLTKSQWNAIYEMVNIQKARMELNTSTDKNEQKAKEILQKHFERIETLSDLYTYRRWAERRQFVYNYNYKTYNDADGKKREQQVGKWNTYKFNKSMLDYLSVINTTRWWKTVVKKQRFLQSRVALFNKLDDAIESTCTTSLPEAFVTCPHPSCERMAVGHPQFAIFKENKGHLFVQCDCSRHVWLIAKDESGSDIKTQEEAVDAYINTNK